MPQPRDDLSWSFVALDQHKTLIAVVELSRSSWLVGAIVPGVHRHPEESFSLTRRPYFDCYTVGAMKQPRQAARSPALLWLLKQAETASGWRAGYERARLKRM